jgi:hypothetical protein
MAKKYVASMKTQWRGGVAASASINNGENAASAAAAWRGICNGALAYHHGGNYEMAAKSASAAIS